MAIKAGTQEGTRAATKVAILSVTLVVTREVTLGVTLGVTRQLTLVTILVGIRVAMGCILVARLQQQRQDTHRRLRGVPSHSSAAALQGPTSRRRHTERTVALCMRRRQHRVPGSWASEPGATPLPL